MDTMSMVRFLRGIGRFGLLEGLLILSMVSLVLQLNGDRLYAWWNRPRPGIQVPQEMDLAHLGTMHYLLYLPKRYNESKKDCPLLVFLHGAGERGTDLEMVKRFGPPWQIEVGRELPFAVLSPQCGEGQHWNKDRLLELIERVTQEHHFDPDRIYVSGYSMGGSGTWMLAAAAPERFAAAIPLCGGWSIADANRLKDVPLWVFHGDRDEVVPIKSSQEMVDAIEAVGGEVKFSIYSNEGHGISHKTYDDPEVYAWMLNQHRINQVSAK